MQTNFALCIINRDLRISIRNSLDLLVVFGFFIFTVLLMPLTLSAYSEVISIILVVSIWVTTLLSYLISLDRLFRSDFEDGSLEQYVLSEIPLPLIVLYKCFAFWLLNGLPIVLIAPLLGMVLGVEDNLYCTLVLSLILGTILLTFVGAPLAALTVGLRKGGLILSLIVLPFMIPSLLLGISASEGELNGLGSSQYLYFLASIIPITMFASVLISTAALKLSWE
tara:strand:- start:576 stop:1247 length:672 start_codon:yes stop_codon:yes gene_type:complete